MVIYHFVALGAKSSHTVFVLENVIYFRQLLWEGLGLGLRTWVFGRFGLGSVWCCLCGVGFPWVWVREGVFV